jgi:ArsR family transcriptional regulator
MRYLVKIFKALSDTNRIRILKMLQIRPLCVCEISSVLSLANSTVSKHLSILKDTDFITDRKENKWVIYSLNRTTMENHVRDLLPLMEEWVPNDTIVLRDAEKVQYVDRNILCGVPPVVPEGVIHE